MESTVFVFGADRYKMDNASGCKLSYVELTEVPQRVEDQKGYHPVTENLDYSIFDQFVGVGLYRAKYVMSNKTARNGKSMMALSIQSIEPIELINLVELAD